MAYDAGMLACCLDEIRKTVAGGKVEKVNQPTRDEVVLTVRSREGSRMLGISLSGNSRISLTERKQENPPVPPMFCMLLRKHLTGAVLTEVRQEGFERVAVLVFEGRDEMGFGCERRLVAEMMGKYSNLIFTDGTGRILGAWKTVDFSDSALRQILPGMKYELPPRQDKTDPLSLDRDAFFALCRAGLDRRADKFIQDTFLGVSAAVAREIAFRASGKTDTPLCDCDSGRVWSAFDGVFSAVRDGAFSPAAVFDAQGEPVEYAFLPLTQYGDGYTVKEASGIGALLDAYFGERDRVAGIRHRASDILTLLSNAKGRIGRKLAAQSEELAACEMGATYKKYGDLITGNLYLLRDGTEKATLTDYGEYRDDGTYGEVEVTLDPLLTPVQNAQKYYKKYAKSKTAREILTVQVEKDREELAYLDTVEDALTHAETAQDLSQIREELSRGGYASRMKKTVATVKKSAAPTVMRFITRGGYTVLCGKNNVQNEYVTHKLAEKNDYWFHAKGVAGSHAVLVTGGEEPDADSFTDAAMIAAYYSGVSDGKNVPVDYTLAKNVKKPAGGKPGLVIYHTNWTAYVTPDRDAVMSMRKS